MKSLFFPILKKTFFILILNFLSFVGLNAQCTEAKDAKMAEYKRKTETQDAQGCSQCAMLALYRCSARHTNPADAQTKNQVDRMIKACIGNIKNMGQPYCCPELLGEPEWGKEYNKNGNSTGNGNTTSNDIENKVNDAIVFGQKLQTSFYSMNELTKNQNQLNDLTNMKGKFNSIEEIELAFQKKFNQISSAVDITIESENSALTNATNALTHFSDTNMQTIGQIGSLVGGLVNTINSEERKREYQELLRKQKEEQISKLKAMKASQIIEVRKTLIQSFPDGGLPKSSKSINNDIIYVFSYSTNQYSFIKEKPILNITNVFPIKRNSNGTWIFKDSLIKNLRTFFNDDNTPTILGFFTSEKDADSLRDSFLYLASQCDFDLKFSTFNIQNEEIIKQDKDFWNN